MKTKGVFIVRDLNWYSPHRILSTKVGDEITCITPLILKKWLNLIGIRIDTVIGNCFSIIPNRPNFPNIINFLGSIFPKFADDIIIVGRAS